MASAGSLIFELAADVSRLRTDMSKAQAEIKSSLDEIGRNTAVTALKAGYDFAMNFARGFADEIKKAVDEADALGKLSERIGTTTEQLSALTYAGSFAGVSVDDMATAFKGLNKAMVDAQDPSSNAAKAIEALGLNVEDLRNSDPGVAMSKIAEAMSGFKDGAEKAAVATELFGKQGQALIPLMNEGAKGIADATKEAQDMGAVVNDETAQAMAELNDNLQRLDELSKGAARTIAADLAPALTGLTVALRESIQDGGGLSKVIDWLGKDLANLVLNATYAGGTISNLFKEASSAIGAMKLLMKGDVSGAKAAWADSVKASQERTAALNATIEETRYKMTDMGRAFTAWEANSAKATAEAEKQQIHYGNTVDKTVKRVKTAVDEYKKMFDSMTEALRVAQANGSEKKLLETDPKFLTMTQQQQDALRGLLDARLQVTAANEAAKKAEDDMAKAAEDANKDIESQVKSLQSFASAQLDSIDPTREYVRTIEQLIAAQNEGMITAEQFAQLQANAAQKMVDATNKLDPTADKFKDLQQAVEGFGKKSSDALVDFVFATEDASVSFSEMVISMLKDLAKLLVYKNVFEPLVSGINKGMSGGNMLSSIMGAFGGARMAGGPVNPGQFYRVNETPLRGEYFSPNVPGRITSGDPSGGGVNVTVNVHKDRETEDTKGDEQKAIELGKRISSVVRQVIATEKRTGGLLAS